MFFRFSTQNNSTAASSQPRTTPGPVGFTMLRVDDKVYTVTNIYVGNLPYSTQEDELIEHFSQWGKVERATLVFDRETGRPRGFGFVEMEDQAAARKAIEEAHGEAFQGRPLTVNEARPRGSGRTGGSYVTTQQTTNLTGETAPRASTGYSNRSPAASPTSRPTPRPEAREVASSERVAGGGYANYHYG